MARKSDRDRRAARGAEERLSHNPFASLKSLLKKSGKKLRPREARSPRVEHDDTGAGPLEELIAGRSSVDIRLTDEYMEGAARGTHPDVLENLAEGRYSHQDFIDLHGLTSEEAQAELLGFLEKSYSLNLRCVLVVHGRGLKSPGEPVLKRLVLDTLTTGPGRKMVLAFATARRVDGGPGATYVLLRKHKKKGVFER